MICYNIMSQTTDIQMIFVIGHKVYKNIGMIDHITTWISAKWEMGYSKWKSLMSALITD